MPSDNPQKIPVSSYASKLAKAKKEGLTFVTSGYIGEANERVVRLYFDLSLETYADIPRAAVLDAKPIKGDMHERAELMVMGNSDIQLVHQQTRTVKAGELQQAMDDRKNQAMGGAAQALPPRVSVKPAPDPCAKPPASSECGCQEQTMHTVAPPSAEQQRAERDPLRRVARWAMGPVGLLF